MLSIIIPSRTEKYLNKTIKDVLSKATGEIEVIVVLDGYGDYPYEPVEGARYISFPPPTNHERRKRQAINTGVSISNGEYICWMDAHCAVAPGFDEILKRDCKDNWVVVPSMYQLDPEGWDRTGKPENYRYWTWDSIKSGKRLKQWTWKKDGPPIDDVLCAQGSFFFMTRKWFDRCGFMQTKGYMGWGEEGEEVCLTTRLNGGKVKVNKNTWYAHLSKSQMGKRMYKFVSAQPSYEYSYKHWVNQKDFFVKTINDFMPIPNYPSNWEEIIYG